MLKRLNISILSILAATSVHAQEIEEGYPEHLAYLLAPPNQGHSEIVDQNIATARLWEPGSTLKVCFFGGDPVVRELVSTVGSQWGEHANLRFDFGQTTQQGSYDCGVPSTGFAHIRVGFSERGYWSAVGTDSVRRMNQYQPSMNLEAFDFEFSSANGFTKSKVVARASKSRKGTILHEFGHAIALLHEHQNKSLDCWKEIRKTGPNNVYDYFAAPPNRWNRLKVERNLSNLLTFDPDANGGKGDPTSIMMYLIPKAILHGGASNKCFIPTRNTKISALDKQWVAAYYPATGADQPISDIDLGGAIVASLAVSESGSVLEEDLQRVLVDLGSDDTSIRRGARAILADIVSDGDQDLLDRLTTDITTQSYRQQLGIAVAISNGGTALELPPTSRSSLEEALTRTNDPTLSNFLERSLQER